MKISEAFAGNYLKAADLPAPKVFTMQTVTQETLGEDKETKPFIKFHGEQRGLVLNKVNALEIVGMYGDETSNWPGHQVELYATQTFFSGRQVPCIRVRRPAPQPVPTVAPVLQQQCVHTPPVPQPVVQAPVVDFPFDA